MKRGIKKKIFALVALCSFLSSCNVGVLNTEYHRTYLRFYDYAPKRKELATMSPEAFLTGRYDALLQPNPSYEKTYNFSGYYWADGIRIRKDTLLKELVKRKANKTERRVVQTSPHTSVSEIKEIYEVSLGYLRDTETFTITYHLDGGYFYIAYVMHSYCLKELKGQDFANLKDSIPEPNKSGYIFAGWVDQDGNPFDWDAVTGDIELYASWTPRSSQTASYLDYVGGTLYE